MTPKSVPSEAVLKPRVNGKLKRVLARQFAWVSSGRILAALLQTASLVLVSRLLPVSDFGYLATFLGVTSLAQVVLDFGVGTLVSRERAAKPDNPVVAAALRFTNVSSVGLTALLLLGLTGAALFISEAYWQMLPLAVWAAAERNADTRLAVAFADGDVQINVINLLARRTAALGLFVAATALGVLPILAFSVSSALAAIGSATFAQRWVRRRVVPSREIGFSEVVRRARPYWVTAISTQARNLDVVVVSALAGATQAGLYLTGSRLMNPLRILPASLATILLPASARTQNSAHDLRSMVRLTVAVVAGMSVLYAAFWLAVPTFVDQALGSAYVDATPVIRIIVAGLPVAATCSMLNSILQGRGRGKDVALAASSTTVACLLGVALISPFYGAIGAATALSLSFVVQLGLLLRPWRRMLVESRVDQG